MQTMAKFCLSDKLVIFVSVLSLPLAHFLLLMVAPTCWIGLTVRDGDLVLVSNDNGPVWNGHVPSGYFIPHQQDSLFTTFHTHYFLYTVPHAKI